MKPFDIPLIQIPDQIPPDGFTIPVFSSSVGMKNLPYFALAHNSLSPLFILFSDRFEFRVLRRRVRHYSDVERIDGAAVNSDAKFRRDVPRYLANIHGKPVEVGKLGAVCAFLPAQGVPLTERANNLIVEYPV